MKLRLPANHPAKKILISELLDKVLAGSVPQSQWAAFLKTEFEKFKQ